VSAGVERTALRTVGRGTEPHPGDGASGLPEGGGARPSGGTNARCPHDETSQRYADEPERRPCARDGAPQYFEVRTDPPERLGRVPWIVDDGIRVPGIDQAEPGWRARPRPGPNCLAHQPCLAGGPPARDDPSRTEVAVLAELPNPVVAVTAVPDSEARLLSTRLSLSGATRLAVVPFHPALYGHRMSLQDQEKRGIREGSPMIGGIVT
jgi:hypothetical protein